MWKACVCYCDVFSLAYVYFDQLQFCVVCVDGLGYVVSVMLYPCMFYVAQAMDQFGLCVACVIVFVN